MTRDSNTIIESLLKPSYIGLEWGSGCSTIWFSKREKHLTSVENLAYWYKQVSHKLKLENLTNVNYLFIPDYDGSKEGTYEMHSTKYVQVANSFSRNSLDFVLVDGVYRSACAVTATGLIKSGGFLIIDDVNWFLPSNSISPGSRNYKNGPLSEQWKEFSESVKDWQLTWTSNGVKDTAIFFKP